MLTLVNPLTVSIGNETYTVYRDDLNKEFTGSPSGDERQVLRFYLMVDTPKIAIDSSGNQLFSLIVYRQDEDRIDPEADGDLGGGILTFTVELAVDQSKFEQIRGRVRAIALGEDVDDTRVDVDLSYVEFKEGTVSVAVAGEGAPEGGASTAEFVEGIVGNGTVSSVGANRKAVMVKLTQAGAALMSQLERLRTLPINVQYRLTLEHRLVGVTMSVWCDVSSSYTLAQTVVHKTKKWDRGYLREKGRERIDKVTSVTEILTRNKTAGVTVTPETSEIDAETLLALEKFGFEMLNDALDKALEASPPPEELDRNWLTSVSQTYSNSLNFTLTRRMVLEKTISPSANISNVFQTGDFDELVTFVDLRTAFFKLLEIPVRVNADFTRLPIDSVTVTIDYKRERVGGGGQEDVTKSFDFKDGATIQKFAAFANRLRDLTYDWRATVHYKGEAENYQFGERTVRESFLVVDVGRMGMLDVEVGLGLVDTAKFPSARINLRYRSGALGRTLERSFVLKEDTPGALWTEVIREPPREEGYEYKVDWLRADGDILEGDWTPSTASRLQLNAPVTDQLLVNIVCTGNFKDGSDQISQVAVSLRYSDAANNYTVEDSKIFTDDKQQHSWSVDLRNRELRDYEYKYSIIYVDGVVKEVPEDGSWINGQPGFISVGEKYTLEVLIEPSLLEYPAHARIVQVDLTYEDAANGIRETDTFLFNAGRKDPQTWRVRGAPNGPKRYTYVVKYHSATGEVLELDPVKTEAEAIVLTPASAPTPEPTPTPEPEPEPTPAPPGG